MKLSDFVGPDYKLSNLSEAANSMYSSKSINVLSAVTSCLSESKWKQFNMLFTGFLHLVHVSYLSQWLHVEGTCLRENLTNLLTSSLQQKWINGINLQHINNKANAGHVRKQIFIQYFRHNKILPFTATLSLLQSYAYVHHEAFVRFLFQWWLPPRFSCFTQKQLGLSREITIWQFFYT